VLLSNMAHRRQRREADCLVACVAMVLDYLGVRRDDAWLSNVLGATAIGAPFSSVEKLTDILGLGVDLGENGALALFASFIDTGLPVIVAVDTDDFARWPYFSNHAVVVIGFDDDQVYVHDPALDDAPQEVEIETFLWAWSRRDYEFAVIRLTMA
jgi:ABC-type bacteriocin/lantibiotic exporter with double-glycine peptidase domain